MTRSRIGRSRRVVVIAVSSAVVLGSLSAAPPAMAEPSLGDASMPAQSGTGPGAGVVNTRGDATSSQSKPTAWDSSVLARTGAGPDGIAVDAFNNVYTANSRANTVTKITPSGKSSTLGTTGATPRGIALDSSGNVYTSNLGANTVTKITPSGVSSEFGTTGQKPIGIAVDPGGNVYTTNYVDSTVTKITSVGVSSTLAGTGSRPLGITLDPSGNVYTANEGANTVTKITPGGVASTFGKTGGWPQGIVIDDSGNLYTANWNSRNVSKITPKGKSSILGRTGRRPIGITVDPNGAVFTTNNGSHSVSRISRGGRSKEIARTGRRPIGIASDAAGFLYTANFVSNTVTEIYPSPKSSAKTLKLDTVTVGSPRNRKAWIIPFWNDVYSSKASCLAAFPSVRAAIDLNADPSVQAVSATSCMSVGRVAYKYQIAETELTVSQWVTFLNVVDPQGKNRHRLWDAAQSSRVWPKYGSVNRNMRAPQGQHYYVASPEWANKPYNVADFTRAARLTNSITNGRIIKKSTSKISTVSGKRLTRTSYTVRLSPKTESGMYKMSNRKATRSSSTGFAVSSQNEWIKAAYFDPKGGGKHSYWDYPTNPGRYVNCPVDVSGCAEGDQPSATKLDANGNVTNAKTQPLASFEAVPGIAPDWCPSQFTTAQCAATPFEPLENIYVGNMSSVGQARTRSPWGTLDQGGNVVEVTDTIAPPPPLGDTSIVWRRWHGGVVTATAYQMWLSAVGVTPQTVPGYAVNPWRGIRLVVRGK
jgi:streptogramin lyase